MEPVITEGAVRTVETVTNRVVSSKTVVQRTANTTSTHVNKYDAEGNLKSSDVDSQTFEERDTKSYQWSDPAQRPPTPTSADGGPVVPAITGGELSVENFLAAEQSSPSAEGATLVMTTTDLVPGARWSGTAVEQHESNVVAAGDETIGSTADVQASQRTTTNMAGESWSRSGEAVWITEATKKTPASSATDPTRQSSTAVENNVAVGVLVEIPTVGTSAASTASPSSADTASAPAPGPLKPAAAPAAPPADAVTIPTPAPSIEERRRRRCQENRERKAALAVDSTTAGVVQPSTA